MGDRAEYNRLVRDKSNAQSRLNSAIRERDAIQDKIDRLKAAKRALSEEYDSFSVVRKTVKNDVQQSYEWQGAKYDLFSAYGSSLVNANNTYYANLDDARDEINLAISRLENQLYEQEGLMGRLRSLINSLAHRIENFFND